MRSSRLSRIAVMAAVAFGVATAVWAAAGPFASKDPFPAAQRSCAAPDLAGTVVDVTLTDGARCSPASRARQRRDAASSLRERCGRLRAAAAIASCDARAIRTRAWGILANPATVPAGTVSLQVRNTGTLTHRVVVLPLAQGRFPGQRLSGLNGHVDESDSQGEVARACGADDADGIAAGTTGWTTISLPVGR
jgi:hypothetical protein